MSKSVKASVIIVSRDRPDDLKRVLASLQFQTYDNFEVIVVSNHNPSDERVKYVKHDQPNISTARNIGLKQAAGAVVAFCDDDAIPEPEWLARLMPAFENQDVAAAGGFVRGRNGISYQWKGLETNQFGIDRVIEISTPLTRGLVDGWMLKVQGTNCAFRKSAVTALGGFDQGFAFYLDETDMAWRLAQAGWLTQIVPNAEVQHGFASSELRGQNRAPKSLRQVGMSKRHFLAKHAQGIDTAEALQSFHKTQRARLAGFLIWGQIEPRDVTHLMQSLDIGLSTETDEQVIKFGRAPKFIKFPNQTAGRRLVYSSIWHIRKLMRYSADLASQGYLVTAFCFSRTSKFHNRYFDVRGFWVQRGGIFGKSDRKSGYINPRMISILRRVQLERDGLAPQRSFEDAEVYKLD